VIKITYWHVNTPTLECVRCHGVSEFKALCVMRGFEHSAVPCVIIPASTLGVTVHCYGCYQIVTITEVLYSLLHKMFICVNI
jgi:hypothetical protein